MNVPPSVSADAAPIDPEQARVLARVKLFMAISGGATLLGIAVVLGVVGYRVSKGEGSAAAAVDQTVVLPKGARVLSTAVAGDRIVVTVETAAGPEVRTFEAQTLRPTGRLRFATEP